MSTTEKQSTESAPAQPEIDKAQFGLVFLLAALGAYTIYDATTLQVGFADPVGPRVFPFLIGSALLVLAALLLLATIRGERGEEEGGEDIDLDHKPDMVTTWKLIGILLFNIVTIEFLGWAITGAILFAGSAWALGSKTPVRDVLIGAVMSVGSWYFFYVGLDIPLSPGILDGIL